MSKYKTINIDPAQHRKLMVWCAERGQYVVKTVGKLIEGLLDGRYDVEDQPAHPASDIGSEKEGNAPGAATTKDAPVGG